MQKPTIPQGTRDFSPEEMTKRNYIFDTIRAVFRLYGFKPIETPAVENLSTLMGKYGEEGDKLLFKILDSGEYLDDFTQKDLDSFYHILEVQSKISIILNSRKSKEEILHKISKFTVSDIGAKIIKRLEVDEYIINKECDEYDIRLSLKELKSMIDDIFNINSINDVIKNTTKPKIGKEKGLRYDLTVPFARFVVMHRNEITFPFRRYQIQPVWRADRPQKGRYREFYQCDADVIGSDSLLNEVELIQLMDEVYKRFGIRVCIKINNRKILSGIAEIIGEADKIVDITVAIDKFDKIGLEKVNEELSSKGISDKAIEQLQPIIGLSGSNREKLNTLKNILKSSEIGLQGIREIETILDKIELTSIVAALDLDLTLARGLNYYTGAIFEVKALDVEIGSITGGGRYDNLTGVFGMPGVSGVGISFGADRIFDVLNQLNLYPENSMHRTQVMFVNFGEQEENYVFPILLQLREKGICSEIYPEAAKLKKQLSYADSNQIPFVVMAGENERATEKLTVKKMSTGEQIQCTAGELCKIVSR